MKGAVMEQVVGGQTVREAVERHVVEGSKRQALEGAMRNRK